jgi:hypothetical protein
MSKNKITHNFQHEKLARAQIPSSINLDLSYFFIQKDMNPCYANEDKMQYPNDTFFLILNISSKAHIL